MSGPERQTLDARLAAHLRDSDLLDGGGTTVVAVSGGIDSVALLHLLRFKLEDGWNRLVAAHYDHCMRPGSAGDAAWVSGLCRAWGIPLETGVAERELGSEAEARHARYAFLDRVADSLDAESIATGHQADDQAETVLFRIIRGTGITGLAGIPGRRGRIVRPLLPFHREEIVDYARSAGLRYREDPTNRSLGYARNRIRHEILPRLEDVSPGAAEALVRLAEHARDERDARENALDAVESDVLLETLDHKGFVLDRDRLLSYRSPLRSWLLRRLLARLGSHPDHSGTEAILTFITTCASGGTLDARGGVIVEREFDRIRVYRPASNTGVSAGERALVIAEPGEGQGAVVIGGRDYRVAWSAGGRRLAGASAEFDAAAVKFPLEVRGWRPGDRLRLSYGTKKLKKLYAERRIGRSARDSVPVLMDAGGRILWVVGIARAAVAGPADHASSFRVFVSGAERE